jgi:hypothetical protein
VASFAGRPGLRPCCWGGTQPGGGAFNRNHLTVERAGW